MNMSDCWQGQATLDSGTYFSGASYTPVTGKNPKFLQPQEDGDAE